MQGSSRYKQHYGDNFAKRPPDYTRCCEEVTHYIGNWSHWDQCARKRGHGPDGAYCKQHDPEVVAKRNRETREREDARYQKLRLELAGPRFFAILEKIASGHNDPRTLAKEAIAPYRRALEEEK